MICRPIGLDHGPHCDDDPDDVWAPYAVAGLHRGPDHTKHFHHRDREVPQK